MSFSEIVGEYVVELGYDYNSAGIERLGADVSNIGAKLAGVGAGLTAALTVPIGLIGLASIKAAAQVELLETNFSTLLGSAEAGAEMFQKISTMAKFTPFGKQDLAKGTETMLAFGIASEKILPTMANIGDVALGNKDKFNRLTLAYSQVAAATKLQGQDLLQMVNAGFNPLLVISQKTGKSMLDLKDDMAAGAISFKMVEQAFKDATAEGGLFYQGMAKGAETLTGRWSTFRDAIFDIFADIGSAYETELKQALDGAIALVGMLGKLATSFKNAPGWIKAAVAGVAAFLAAIGPILVVLGSVLMLVGSFIGVAGLLAAKWVLITTAISAAGAFIAGLAAPLALVAAGLAAIALLIWSNWNFIKLMVIGLGNAFEVLWLTIKPVIWLITTAIGWIWKALKPVLKIMGVLSLAALLWVSPVVAGVLFVIAAINALIAVVNILADDFFAFSSGGESALAPMWSGILKTIDFFKMLWGEIKIIWKWWGGATDSLAEGIVNAFINVRNKIFSVFDGVKAKLADLMNNPFIEKLMWLYKHTPTGIVAGAIGGAVGRHNDRQQQGADTIGGVTGGNSQSNSNFVENRVEKIEIVVAETNASPADIAAAASGGVNDAFAEIYNYNAPSWGF